MWAIEVRTHVVENNQLVGPTTLVGADGVENTVSDKFWQKLLNEEEQKDTADDGQVKVVDLEEKAELEGLATAHEFSAAEDDDVVGDEHGDGLLEGSHWRLARNEAEVAGVVAFEGDESSLKDGPQLKTEGTVERGNAILDPVWLGHVARDAPEGNVCFVERVKRGRRKGRGPGEGATRSWRRSGPVRTARN